MTILGLRYRPGVYEPVPQWRRWLPLARHEFLSLFRSKWGVALFCACLLPMVIRLFVLMIRFGVVNFGAATRNQMVSRSQALAQWDPQRPDFFVEMVMGTFPGLFVLVLITCSVTAGAVARDRRTNALELFWTRGISPFAYLFGKWMGSLVLLAALTVGAPLFLWGVAVLLADDWSQLTTTLPFLLPMLGGLLLVTAAWTAICVLLSVLCSSPNQAVVGWCMLVVGSTAMGNVLAVVLRESSIRSWLSLWDAGGVLARAAAGMDSRGSITPAALFLGGLIAVLWLLAHRRLVLSEAVG